MMSVIETQAYPNLYLDRAGGAEDPGSGSTGTQLASATTEKGVFRYASVAGKNSAAGRLDCPTIGSGMKAASPNLAQAGEVRISTDTNKNGP